ncbi:MAG TPA: DUF4189 domain-containing protein [Candidatus Binataceae bacterium]|nr:DUF4189 domain-containing protein [Candidatus Binataceae bacterium]
MPRPILAMDCFDYCEQAGGVGDCSTRCSPGGDLDVTHPWHRSSAPAPYGAIAYGVKTGAEGISWGKPSLASAQSAAFSTCARYGNNCKIVADFSNNCAALAVAKGAVHYTTAIAHSLSQAEYNALNSCKLNWGVCEIDLSTCSPK